MTMSKSNFDPRSDTTGTSGCMSTIFGDLLYKHVPKGSTMNEWGNYRRNAKREHIDRHIPKIEEDPRK